jgi:sugar phosphate isomerase/epimerase
MNRPVGLAALTVLELAPPDQVTCAADAGYGHVGLRLLPATAEELQHPMVGDTPMVRETAQRLEHTGVRVIDVEIFRLKPATRVEDYRAALETGARLGATEALIAGNDPDASRLVDNFAKFCDMALEYGMAANLEPMPWTDVRNFAEAVRIVGLAGRDNAGVLIDPIHFDRGESRVEEIESVPPGWLRYVQLCDAPARRPQDVSTLLQQARAERLMPGDGGLDLRGILHAVPSHIPISIEIPMQELARTVPAVERARQMLAKTHALLATIESSRPQAPARALPRTT